MVGMKQALAPVMDVINVLLCDTGQESWYIVTHTINCEFYLCQRVFETLPSHTWDMGHSCTLLCDVSYVLGKLQPGVFPNVRSPESPEGAQ